MYYKLIAKGYVMVYRMLSDLLYVMIINYYINLIFII